MERYYYDDAIEAAYMIEHFAFGILTEHRYYAAMSELNPDLNKDFYYLTPLGAIHEAASQIESGRTDCKYYFHPDSVKLLEPQENDLVDLGDHGFAIVVTRDGNNIDCALFDASSGLLKTGYWHRRWHPIIQRNNKAFIMPKSEVV